MAAALTDSLLSARLGLLNYVEGHHAAVVIFGALGLAAVYALARAFGKLAALCASLLYATHPLLFTYAHNDVKDLPEAALIAATLYLGVRWLQSRRYTTGLAAGTVLALALDTKPNAIFVPFVLLAGWLVAQRQSIFAPGVLTEALKNRRALVIGALELGAVVAVCGVMIGAYFLRNLDAAGSTRLGHAFQLTRHLPLMLIPAEGLLVLPTVRWVRGLQTKGAPEDTAGAVVATLFRDGALILGLSLALIVIFWPLLWTSLGSELITSAQYWAQVVGAGTPVYYFGHLYFNSVDMPWHYGLVMLAITTPLLGLVLAAVGMVVAARSAWSGKQNLLCATLLAWVLLPTLRTMMPGSHIYSGSRQFLDVPLALCVLGGLGASWIACLVSSRLASSGARVSIVSTAALPALILTVQGAVSGLIQPYGVSFYNLLVGGPAGATSRFDLNDWGDPIRHEVEWANVNLPPNARINFVPAWRLVDFESLRPDLRVVHGTEPLGGDYVLAGDYVLVFPYYAWLNDPTAPVVGDSPSMRSDNWLASQRDLETIYIEKRMGAPMFIVFKNPAAPR